MESEVLAAISGAQPPPPPHYTRRTVFVFVDSFDLATLAALRYARSLRPTSLRAVHFVIDNVRAEKLREEWTRANRGVILDFIDVPDRRLTRAAAELVGHEVEDPGTHVTVILPRRSYSAWFGRLLHDRTADKIAAVVSRIPRSAATIVPYDVQSRVPGAAGAPRAPGRHPGRPAQRQRTRRPSHPRRRQACGTARPSGTAGPAEAPATPRRAPAPGARGRSRAAGRCRPSQRR